LCEPVNTVMSPEGLTRTLALSEQSAAGAKLVRDARRRQTANWLSEREWIPVMLETADKPRRLQLKLDVNEANIDELERQSCEEIFLAREREYQQSYRHTPALEELAARYGDTTNRRVYMMSRDVEERWLDLHRRETGAAPPID
jgi:hypothetical protein